MTKVSSCERLQNQCRSSKVLEGLWPANQEQQPGTTSWSCVYHSTGLASAVTCDGQQNDFVRFSGGER